MAYTTVAEVAAAMGVQFTGAQEDQCTIAITQATAIIDSYCQTGWDKGAQQDVHTLSCTRVVWLKYIPVASIDGVWGNHTLVSPEEELVPEQYVIEMDTGRVILLGHQFRVRISYTQQSGVPHDVRAAATELVAARMATVLAPGTTGIESLTLPDYSVKFGRDRAQGVAIPTGVRQLLDIHRRLVGA